MDLFNLAAKLTLDSSGYESGIQQAAQSQSMFAENIDQVVGSSANLEQSLINLQQEYNENQIKAKQLQSALNELAAEGNTTSGGFQELSAELAKTQQYSSALQDKMKSLKSNTNGVGDSADLAGKAVEMFGGAISKYLGPTAIIATAKALGDLVQETAEFGDAIDKQSQKLGISAQAYQKWEAVLQHSGSSMSSMSFTFRTLANAAQDATDDQIAAFERLGISLDEVKNMSTEDLFENVIYALQGLEEGTERTAIATDLLGRGAMELGPLLNTSAEETQEMLGRVDALGIAMSDDAVEASAAFKDAVQDLTTSIEGNIRNMAANVLPILTDVIEFINEANEQAGLAGTVSQDTLNRYDTASEKLIALKDNYHEVNEAAKELALSGEYDQMAGAQLEINNAWEQYQQTLEELRPEVFEELKNGTIGVATASTALGMSASELRNELQVSGELAKDLAEDSEDVAEALDEEALAAQEATQSIWDIANASLDAIENGDDLREAYNDLSGELDHLREAGDETAIMWAEHELAILNVLATNQELENSYPGLVDSVGRFGFSVSELSGWLIDNGITAEEWGEQVQSATDGIVNSFQLMNTDLGLSLEDMATNLQANIDATAEWNTNMAALWQAAAESGQAGAMEFVQYMQDMGPAAAAQVAAMADDLQGTLDTFAPMFADAADQGVLEAYNAIEGADVSTAASDTMQEAVDAADQVSGWEEVGSNSMDQVATGETSSASNVSNAATSAVESAKSAAAAVGGWSNIGYNMVSGMAAGVRSGSGVLSSAVAAVVRSAVSAARAAGEIASPSKLFAREVGKWIPAGIAKGIDDNVVMVEDSMKNLINTTQTGDYTSRVSVDKDGSILSMLQTYLPQLARMSVTLQDGAVVGRLTPRIDTELGSRQTYTARGLA